MCFGMLASWLRQYIIQCKARFRYRLDRWRSGRARKKWLKREAKYQQDLAYQKYLHQCQDNEYLHQSKLIIKSSQTISQTDIFNIDQQQALVVLSISHSGEEEKTGVPYMVAAEDRNTFQPSEDVSVVVCSGDMQCMTSTGNIQLLEESNNRLFNHTNDNAVSPNSSSLESSWPSNTDNETNQTPDISKTDVSILKKNHCIIFHNDLTLIYFEYFD